MAPTLTSNSLLLTTTPHSRITLRNPRLTVFAKKSGPFSSGEEERQNSIPFKFNFGKFPDVKSLVPVVNNNQSPGLVFGNNNQRKKDGGTVFVAGATGQVGIRIAQTLLREGFSVRAGVPDLGAAQELARLAASYKIISNEELKRLNAVDSTFQDAEQIAKAIGSASKVVVTIGPSENGPNAEVTTSDALQVIQAAQLANVGHVAIIYDGTSGTTSTYNVLDGIQSFFSNLFSKSQPLTITEFLQKVVETDVSYTLIKTSLTEDFAPESSYNIVVSAEDTETVNDFKVAKSRIASLVADVFSNTEVSENKVVNVSTDPSAPSKSFAQLFSAIPEDGRRKAYAEATEKAKAEEEKAREAAEAALKFEEQVKELEKEEAPSDDESLESLFGKAKGISWEKLSSQLKSSVRKPAEEVKKVEKEEAPSTNGSFSWEKFSSQLKSSVQKPEKEVKKLAKEEAPSTNGSFSWEKLSSQLKSAVQKPEEEEPKVRLATIRGQAKARSLPSVKAVVKKSSPTKTKEVAKPKAKQPAANTETRKVFGGLFKQETIYIDDD